MCAGSSAEMETLIFLNTMKQYQSFYREITNKILKGLLNSLHLLILWAIKKVLGKEFLMSRKRWRENLDILAMFLAIFLYMGLPKERSKKLYHMVFEHAWLGEIDEAVDNVDGNLLVPFSQHYYVFW